jgi:steroid delta-isomerase-like uncharacterized protein
MNTRISLTAWPLATLLLLAACGGPAPEPMGSDHSSMQKADSAAKAQTTAQEAIALSVFEMFNTGNTDGIENIVADDFVDHQKDPSITSTGIQMVKDMLTLYRTSMPDLKQEVLHMATVGDRTYIHLRMTGTNTGAWGDMPPTGKAMDVLGVDIIRFANGKAAEHWGYVEEMKMMQQLGLMPEPGAEAQAKK